MGGILTHTLLGFLSGGIVYYFWRKPEFFFATLVGNTIIDFFKFFIVAINQGVLSIGDINKDSSYSFWANLTNSWTNWYTLGFFIITLLAFLYHHIIRKKTMLEYDEIVWAFLIGVSLHLLLDIFYIEKNIWI